jgi:hypothetical protein
LFERKLERLDRRRVEKLKWIKDEQEVARRVALGESEWSVRLDMIYGVYIRAAFEAEEARPNQFLELIKDDNRWRGGTMKVPFTKQEEA